MEVKRGTCQNGSKMLQKGQCVKRLECSVSDMHPPACFQFITNLLALKRGIAQYSEIQSILSILPISLSKVEKKSSVRSRGFKI